MNDIRRPVVRVAPAPAPSQFAHVSTPDAIDELNTRVIREGADINFDAAAANTGVKATCADMYAVPFRNASCDIVVSLDTIEHAAAPDRFLTEVGRVLRPGGSALIITPNVLGYHAMIAKMIGFGAELVCRAQKGRSDHDQHCTRLLRLFRPDPVTAFKIRVPGMAIRSRGRQARPGGLP